MRVKGGTVTHARHKKVTDAAKGYYGRRKNTFKVARQAVDKANSTPRATGRPVSAPSARFGSSGSTPLSVRTTKR